MKTSTKQIIKQFLLISGICMLVYAAIIMFSWQYTIHSSVQKTELYIQTLRSLIPEPQGAVPEERRDNTMAVLSLEGVDFVGILEIPRYGSVLPVGASWGHITKYPCLFSGSIYDSSLQIGGTTQSGQYDFYRDISPGDDIYFTDMEGNRFAYTVTTLRYEKHADKNALSQAESDLTLFIKNMYAFEYLIVFCSAVK